VLKIAKLTMLTLLLNFTEGGLVAWEKTMGDVLSSAGYDSYILGKWFKDPC
jgi:arylsulfatase